MHRVNIVYACSSANKFDWHHYLNKHLPIACGISSRHAPIIRCNVDRPIGLGSEDDTLDNGQGENKRNIAAICSVYFSDLTAQNNFRHFFASGHPDSLQIITDEPNYTTIQPTFNAGNYAGGIVNDSNASFRVRFLFPRELEQIKAVTLRATMQRLTAQFEGRGINIRNLEIDECLHDVPKDSVSTYTAITSLSVEDIDTLRHLKLEMSADDSVLIGLQEQFGVCPLVVFSEIVEFNLALCKPYLAPDQENTQ